MRMARRIYEEARGKGATRESPSTSASCTRSRATWARRGGSTIGLAPYKKDVDAISVDELVDHLSSAMDKERPHTGAASLSTTSTSVIPLYHPLPYLFLLLLILLHFPPLPAKSGLSAY